jgi:hypothetical protein
MNIHVISLKGPWTAHLLVSGETRSMRLNIKSSTDWNSWRIESPEAGELILERKFNWLFPEPAPEKVELHVKSGAVPTGKLNGKTVAFEDFDSVYTAEVTHLLESANQVELRFILDHGGSPDLYSVELLSHG